MLESRRNGHGGRWVVAGRGRVMSRCWGNLGVLLLLGMLLSPVVASAGSDEVRAVVLLRALAYDDGLKSRASGKIVIAVVVPNGAQAAENPIHAGMKGISNLTIQGLPLEIVDVPYVDVTTLKKTIASKGVSVLFLGKGLEASLPEIIRFSRESRIPSMTILSTYVAGGVAVAAVQTEQNDKPKLVVNLPSAKAQGMQLRPELLRIAQVIE